jgi:hypothetical protein
MVVSLPLLAPQQFASVLSGAGVHSLASVHFVDSTPTGDGIPAFDAISTSVPSVASMLPNCFQRY